MRSVFFGLLFLLQDDSFRTLADPARRAKEEDRRAALESFRAAAGGSAVHFVAAQFLESGLADCAACGGKGPRDGKSPARPKVSDLYGTEPCPACGGKAWPLVNLAVPCERCFGLGVRVKPAIDASKILE